MIIFPKIVADSDIIEPTNIVTKWSFFPKIVTELDMKEPLNIVIITM